MKLIDLFSNQKFKDLNERNALWRRMTPEERGRVLDAAIEGAESRVQQQMGARHDTLKLAMGAEGVVTRSAAIVGVAAAVINPALFVALTAASAAGVLGAYSVEAYDAIKNRMLDNKLGDIEKLKAMRDSIIHQPDLMSLNFGQASYLGRDLDRSLGQHWDSLAALEMSAPELSAAMETERHPSNEMTPPTPSGVRLDAAGRIEPHFGETESEELAAEVPLSDAQSAIVNDTLTAPVTQFAQEAHQIDGDIGHAQQILDQHRRNTDQDPNAPESVRREATLAAECMANAKREKQHAMSCMEAAHHASIAGNLASVTDMIEQAQTHLTHSASWSEQAALAVAAHQSLDNTAKSMGYTPTPSGGGFRDALKQLGTQLRKLVAQVASIPDLITAAAEKAEAGIYRTAQRFGDIGLSLAHQLREDITLRAGALATQVQDHVRMERDRVVADVRDLVHHVQDGVHQIQDSVQVRAQEAKREVLMHPDVIEVRAAVRTASDIGSLAVDTVRLAVNAGTNAVAEKVSAVTEKASHIVQQARSSVIQVAQTASSARNALRDTMRANRESVRTQTYLALQAAEKRAYPGADTASDAAAGLRPNPSQSQSHAPAPVA